MAGRAHVPRIHAQAIVRKGNAQPRAQVVAHLAEGALVVGVVLCAVRYDRGAGSAYDFEPHFAEEAAVLPIRQAVVDRPQTYVGWRRGAVVLLHRVGGAAGAADSVLRHACAPLYHFGAGSTLRESVVLLAEVAAREVVLLAVGDCSDAAVVA